MDLRYSDRKAQIPQLNVKTLVRKCKKIKSRQYSEKSMEEFKCLLNKESWQEVFQTSEVNSALQVFRIFLVIRYSIPIQTNKSQ
jgi:hypothetical protein